MLVTLQKMKPGKALGTERCRSIVTDDTTLSRLHFLRAAKAVALRGFLGVSRPFPRTLRENGPMAPLSSHLLPKKPLKAIPSVSIYEFTA